MSSAPPKVQPPRGDAKKTARKTEPTPKRASRITKPKALDPWSLTKKLGAALKLMVVGQVKLERKGKDYVILLQEQPALPKALASSEAAKKSPKAATLDPEVLGMQEELAEVLNHHPGTRQALRHLALFERKFKRHGLSTLDDLPIELLQKALHQLDTLCDGVASPKVVMLRSKIEVAMMSREPLDQGPPTMGGALSDFNVPDRVEVAEGTVSDFMRLHQEMALMDNAKAA